MLKKTVLLTSFLFIALPASAEMSCTDWMDQGNGTSWITCVDDAGVQHCYLIDNTPGSVAYEVVCE